MRLSTIYADLKNKNFKQGKVDYQLRLIKKFVEHIISEPINVAHIFGSPILDEACQEIGAINLAKVKKSVSDSEPLDAHLKTVVYVASRLYLSGGHTAALADMIRLSPRANYIVLITGVGGTTDLKVIESRFGAIEQLTFEFAPRGDFGNKLDWLQGRLIALHPSDVWLFNHHQDSVAVAAVQPDQGYRLHFYHHGDHHLCLGVFLKYAEHVDMNITGFHHCRKELNISNNIYVPLVAQDRGVCANKNFKSTSPLVTATAAGRNKLEVAYPICYVDVVPALLKASGGKHIHIGPLSWVARYKIWRGMRQLGLPPSVFIYLPYVASVWQALHDYRVDLYVTSFPYGGARTLIEVMGSGTPIVMHQHHTSRLLGTFDMVYEHVLRWKEPKELYDIVTTINSSILAEHAQLARQRYEQFHSEELLRRVLNGEVNFEQPNLREGYSSDPLQRAVDVCQQVSILGVVKRWVSVMLYKLKSY